MKFLFEFNINVKGLPKQVELSEGQFFIKIDNLKISEETECVINFISKDKKISFQTNPIKVMETEIYHYWGDLHGQSEETIGTGSAEEYFNFEKIAHF